MEWAQKVIDAEIKAYDTHYKQVYDKTNGNEREATRAGIDAMVRTGADAASTQTIISTGLVVSDKLLAALFAFISSFRKQTTHNFDDTAAEVINEFLGTDLDASIMATGQGTDERIQKANAIGKAILNRLEQEFTGGTTDNPGPGRNAAATFAGYGVNFAIQNAIISLIGACVPETRLDDIRELGVEVAGNLGLGALISAALAPLVNATIVKPYTRELSAKYPYDLLGQRELAYALLSERIPADTARQLLREHGLSEQQINELIEQTRLRLHSQEIELLTALGKKPADDAANTDVARGMDADWVTLRLQVENYNRLKRARQRVMQAALPYAKDRVFSPTDIVALAAEIGLPQDEQDLWRKAAGFLYETPHKRLSEANLLFLYEAAQVTLDDVQKWAEDQNFTAEAVQQLLVFFQLKAAVAAQTKSGGSAGKAAHLHIEHVAYVTDEVTGLFGRAPTPAELTYWVNLLDLAERTKHDFTTELKALDPKGSAIPHA